MQTQNLKFQCFVSTSTNPFINLSTEQHIFQSCVANARAWERGQKELGEQCKGLGEYEHPVILMLYVNSPCVVIGRNQNPWTEVNLPNILSSRAKEGAGGGDGHGVSLLRRRSGGGTVFHDLGNVNYSAIVPALGFTRDAHAEMVVEALKCGGAGDRGVRVNERHDVVMAAGVVGVGGEGGKVPEVKLSGSAYKLTRTTGLHHGTMLIDTELGMVKRYINSEAKGWIKGRGVASVRSPIENIKVDGGVLGFGEEVGRAWGRKYGVCGDCESREIWKEGGGKGEAGKVAVCYVTGEEALEMQEIRDGKKELESMEWMFDQTPKFTFSIPVSSFMEGSMEGAIIVPPKDLEKPDIPMVQITSEKGVITGVGLGVPEGMGVRNVGINVDKLHETLEGMKFDGGSIADGMSACGVDSTAWVLRWVEGLLGRIPRRG